MQALLLPIGDDVYAIELARVREVVPAPAVTRLPHAPPGVCGVVNLRGEVVPVLDTGQLLGLGAARAPATHVAVADTPGGPAALTADGMPVRVALGDPAGASELAGTAGRYATPDGGVATLIDPVALIERLERR